MKIVLASASQRRQELLIRITKEFKTVISDFEEDSIAFEGDFSEYVKKLAKGKALSVAKKLNEDCIVIGCDTLVAYDNLVLGKPKDELNAYKMLRMLSGNCHQVYSGIAIVNSSTMEVNADYVCTDVKFSSIADEDIKKYIDSGECMDKAGAYGIQGLGGIFVEEIHGCYYNVVGLPLNKLNCMLKGMGVNL